MYTEMINLEESGHYQLCCRLRDKTVMDGRLKLPALVLVPGGAFGVSDPNDQIAMVYKFMSCNYHVFTYTYAVVPDYRFPDVIIYLSRALKLIREHAEEWGVDPDRIIVGGCSAGAHIAAALGGIWNRAFIQEPAGCTGTENRPDAMMLCYGPLYCNQQTDDGLIYVPTGDLVGPHTPPAFVAHCADDSSVPVDQSLGYAAALCRADIPFSLYISSNGEHGGLQLVKPKINLQDQLTVSIDDWFPAFLKFADNVLGVSPIPVKGPTLEPPGPPEDMPLPDDLPEGFVPGEMPVMEPPRDRDGNIMGTFAAGLKLGFHGGGDELFDNILQ